MKIIELFAGYGSQALALKNLGFEVESKISEIDKYAIQAYEQLHGKTFNYGDISKIKSLGDADLWTYSFPCQDLSVAGKQAGISEGTRSGLLYEVERLLEIAAKNKNKPKYLLLENVKALVSKKFKPDFDRWLAKLDSLGYNNYWQVLNAKDYGIPQNRERVFVVSIRKDVDTKGYKFPSPVPLQKRLKDMLEPFVDEKYYLSADKVDKFVDALNKKIENQDVSYCIDANYWKGTTPQQFLNKNRRQLVKEVSNTIRCGGGSLDGKHTWDIVVEPLCAASQGRNPENPSDRTSGSPTEQRLEINYSGCTNTLTSVQKDNYVVEPFIADDTQGFDDVGYYDNYSPTLRSERSGLKVFEPLQIKEATQKGYAEAYEYDSVSLDHPNSKTRRGRVGKQISNTLTCSCNMGVVEPKVIQVGNIVSTGNWNNPQIGRVYSPEGCIPTLNTCGGGSHEPKIITIGNYMPSNHSASKIISPDGITPTVMENHGTVTATVQNYRIRKLTPRECWRLMGVKDEQFDRLHGISNSQLYKLAGNSIVVDVLEAIFRNLFSPERKEKEKQLSLF